MSKKKIDTTLRPERSPTHRCKECGALWIAYRQSWSLCSMECGKCCDNEPMLDQIEALQISDRFFQWPFRATLLKSPSGESFVALVDAAGQIFPGQRASTTECAVGEAPVLTVQFLIDGTDLLLE